MSLQASNLITVLGMPIFFLAHAYWAALNAALADGDWARMSQTAFVLNLSGLGVASVGAVLGIVLFVRRRPPGRTASLSVGAIAFGTVALLITSLWATSSLWPL